jgi:hypothetical protein
LRKSFENMSRVRALTPNECGMVQVGDVRC